MSDFDKQAYRRNRLMDKLKTSVIHAREDLDKIIDDLKFAQATDKMLKNVYDATGIINDGYVKIEAVIMTIGKKEKKKK